MTARGLSLLICQFLALLVLTTGSPQDCCADLVRLAHGGELRGQLVEGKAPLAPADEESLTIRTLAGAAVTVSRENVTFVARRSLVVEEYVSHSRQIPHTVAAHWELADWCRNHKLDDERTEQLLLLLDIDPDHADTRRILGHVQERGQWMTRDQMMTSHGYVRHKGKWITQQELNLLKKNAEQRQAEQEWYPKVRMWSGWLTGTDLRKRTLAVTEFGNIDSGDAVPALVNFLSDNEREDVRMLYLSVLAQIGTAAIVPPLLDCYLNDVSEMVRQQAFLLLPEEHYDAALPILVAALKDELNPVVRRAGAALGVIADPVTVPALIEALITSHRYKVQAPAASGITIGYTPNGQAGMVDPRALSSSLPPEIAGMARTGQLPYGATISPAFANTHVPKFVTVRADIQNDEVLAALTKITGQNLGYNERDWQLWHALNKS